MHLTLAHVLVAQGRAQPDGPYADQAAFLLARLLGAAETTGRTGRVIEVLTLQAQAYQDLGNASSAMAALEQALRLAEPEGYVRLFVEQGTSMATLLRLAQAHGLAPGYVHTLLAACGDQELAVTHVDAGSASALPSAGALVEPLSERERAVLRLLAAGLSSPEIGRQLYVEVSTVKTHLKSLYGKLEVHSREQAVTRARALHLLGD
jgi:LuxR family maltose regulon positive regulatory protein